MIATSYTPVDHMTDINYKHLRCFWATAREGGAVRAADLLGLAQPTVSRQLAELEQSLGEQLFLREGRGLVLTDAGRTLYRYASEIFELSGEMLEAMGDRRQTGVPKLRLGISDSVPKIFSRDVLSPLLEGEQPIRMMCVEGKPASLLGLMAASELHAVISDTPLEAGSAIRGFCRQIGEAPIAVFAAPVLAEKLRPGFPESLDGERAIMPSADSSIRREVERWHERVGVRPFVIAECDDSALIKAIASDGHGFAYLPGQYAEEFQRTYMLDYVGTVEGATEPLYLITRQRRVDHPGIERLLAATDSETALNGTHSRATR